MKHGFTRPPLRLLRSTLALATFFTCGLNLFAEPMTLTIGETAGLRRFGYPVTASLDVPRGALANAGAAMLLDAAGQEVRAQFTAMSTWEDGSVRTLDVDFVSSLAPLASQSFRVETDSSPQPALSNGLTVTETEDEITVTSAAIRHRIRRDGKPLLSSIAFGKQEFLAAGGVTTALATGPVEVLKRGPFNVTLRLGDVRLEYVSTKSWVKITQRAAASTELAVDAHFSLPELPLLWDFGVRSWLYGSLSKADQTALLRQSLTGWRVFTGKGSEPATLFATGKFCEGWGHLAGRERVVAFGMVDFTADGEPNFHLSADGHVRTAVERKELTVYFHVVGHPVQVTALTSPPSMLSPLSVKTGR
jgi:hypothetical protein